MTTAVWSPPSPFPAPSSARPVLPAAVMSRRSCRPRRPSSQSSLPDDHRCRKGDRAGVGIVALLLRRVDRERDVVSPGVRVVVLFDGVEIPRLAGGGRPRAVLRSAVSRIHLRARITHESLLALP